MSADVVRRMPIWQAAALSFLAMCAADCIATAMVVYESRLDVVPAGLCDVAGYLVGLVCSVLALDSILKDGWRTRRSLTIIASVSCANFVGTALGVVLSGVLAHH